MSFLSFLLGQKKTSASVAKERLQIILAHERSGRGASPWCDVRGPVGLMSGA